MNESIQTATLFESGVILYTDKGHSCKIQFVTPEILRVKYCFSPEPSPHSSYAVIAGNEENAVSYLRDEQAALPEVSCGIRRELGKTVLETEHLRVLVQEAPFTVSVYNSAGRLLHADVAERAYWQDSNGRRNHYFKLADFDGFYGFGEKSGSLNKFKRRMRLYNCDTLGYDSEKTDPLYKHIPFFIKRSSASGVVCGMFYDCTHSAALDIGCERSGYWPPYAYLCADGGDIDYYLIAGENIPAVVRGYTLLTGKTILPTYQSLGYMASTMYYTEQDKDCDKGVQSFIEELKRHEFGCDGFHLSSGYTTHEGKRCVFNWNYDRFPDPPAFFSWMTGRGILVSPNIKPALLTTHPLYQEFAQAGAFLTEPNGTSHLERYWGGMASLVDFSSDAGRAMWKKYVKKSLLEQGVTALWDDNNEFEISDPDTRCAGDSIPLPAVSIKPAFANLMAKTGIEAIREHNPAMRPYILSRAGYAGIQRYAQTWAGDNYTSWNNLKYNIPVMLGMGLSGVANQGCDVGGFQGPAPDAELFVRWVENGIFQPRFCIHSCNTDNTVTQPWSYESHISYIRSAFALRYSLGLYLYSCLRISNTQGDPVMRPLVYEFENDPLVAEESFTFLFGPYLLVANVLEPGAITRTVYLPKGSFWYDWHTHARYEGGQTVTVDAPMGKIPLFYRQGAILPLLSPASRMDMSHTKLVRLLVEATQPGRFTLYQDDGLTTAYQNGSYLETEISVLPSAEQVELQFRKSGNGKAYTEAYEIELVCRAQSPLQVSVDGRVLPVCLDRRRYEQLEEAFYFEMDTRHAWIKLYNQNGNFSLIVDYAVKDLIGM